MADDEPKYSKSWDQPCLVDNKDGLKTEWYERDLSPEALDVMGKIISCIKQQQDLAEDFKQARTIVELMMSAQGQQVLLLEKLYRLNPGKNILEGDAKAVLTEVAKSKTKTDKE